MKKPRRPRDPNQLAKLIVDVATGGASRDPKAKPDTSAIEAKRRNEWKGGKARARMLSARMRAAIARKAARVRWAKG
jgi:hypothetical protein